MAEKTLKLNKTQERVLRTYAQRQIDGTNHLPMKHMSKPENAAWLQLRGMGLVQDIGGYEDAITTSGIELLARLDGLPTAPSEYTISILEDLSLDDVSMTASYEGVIADALSDLARFGMVDVKVNIRNRKVYTINQTGRDFLASRK